MLLKWCMSLDMLPFSLCKKKILANRHMNRPLFPTTLSIPSYKFEKYVGLRTYQHLFEYFIQVCRKLSSRTRSCSKAVYKPVWHIPLLSVQWINSWWWTEELSETCRVSCQNKFVKLVHLVGFTIKKFVVMHGHMNVKNVAITLEKNMLRPAEILMRPRVAFLLFHFPFDKITSCNQTSCVTTFLKVYLHPFLSMNYEELLLSVHSSSCAVGALFFRASRNS
jgi:hypothetical protein